MLTGEVAGMIMMSGGGDADFGAIEFNQNGVYTPQSVQADVDGWNQVTVNVSTPPTLQDITVSDNGVYTADSGYDGLGTVTVDLSELIRQAITEAVEGAESVCSGTSITAGDIEFPTGGIPTPDNDPLTALAVTNTMLAADVDASPVNTNNGWCLRCQITNRNIIYSLYNVVTGENRHLTMYSMWYDVTWRNMGYEYNTSTKIMTFVCSDGSQTYRITANMAGSSVADAWNEFCSGSYYSGANPTYVGE